MTIFDELSKRELKCDICGSVMLPLPGGGWDNDRFVCSAYDCGAEIEYPTSTIYEEKNNNGNDAE